MKTGDSETEDAGTSKDRGENVVRFPREWIGPLEELVPIRPATAADELVDEELPPAPDAFWSEDAGALHNAVQAPVDQSAGIDEPGVQHAARRRRSRVRVGRPADQLRTRFGRVSVRQLGVAAVAVPLVAIAVIGTLWGPGGTGAPSRTGHYRSAHTAAVGYGLGQMPARGTQPESALRALRSSSAFSSRRARGSRTHHARATHHASGEAPPANRAGSRAANPTASPGPPEPVSVIPSTGSSSSPSTEGSGNESGTSTPSTSPTSQTAGTSSGNSTSSAGTPAFGSSGALGPGSSPDS